MEFLGHALGPSLYPLAPAQLGIYFEELLSPRAGRYVEQPNWYLYGEINEAAIAQAWTLVARRRDNLRLIFDLNRSSGLPTQLVVEAEEFELDYTFEDWSGLSYTSDQIGQQLLNLLARERAKGFDLASEPPWRVHLIRLARDRFWMCLTLHHLISDGWSDPLVLRDVFTAYAAIVRGGVGPQENAPQFRDYLHWLNTREASSTGIDKAYWRARLRGMISGGHQAASLAPAAEGTRLDFVLDADLNRHVDAFARRHRVTYACILSTAWAASLCEQPQQELVYDFVAAGRPEELAWAGAVSGPFITTVPTRVVFDGDARLGDWVRQQQKDQAEDRAHAVGYEANEAMRVGRAAATTLFAYQNYPGAASFADPINEAASGLLTAVDGVPFYSRTSYQLDITLARAGSVTRASIQGNHNGRELRDATRCVQRVRDRFVSLLTNLADDHRVAEWAWPDAFAPNATGAALPSRIDPPNVLHLFLESLQRDPSRIAVATANDHKTLRDLDQRSSEIAALLRGAGLSAGDVVGVDLARDGDHIAAVLAAWKSECVPFLLNRGDSVSRMAELTKGARAQLVLTDRRQLTGLDIPILVVTSSPPGSRVDPRPLAELQRAAESLRSNDLAYVIATSGTTGTPRLVMNEHGGLVDHVRGQLTRIYPPGDPTSSVVAGTAPVHFDAFLDLWLPALCLGRTVWLQGESAQKDPASILDSRHYGGGISLDMTPEQLSAILELEPRLLRDSRIGQVVIGGERPSDHLWRRLLGVSGDLRAFSVYGATECSIGSSLDVPESEFPTPGLGRGERGTVVRVLDEALRPVRDGVGHAYICGPGVGRGYVGAAAATAAVFLPDPFAAVPGSRMYATGDRVQVQSGRASFLGRDDSQLKLRGQRIDLLEIELVLQQHAGVARAYVFLSGPDRSSLAALIQVRVGLSERTAQEAIDAAAQTLPTFAVPSRWATCEELPLTVSGKIDREAAERLVLSGERSRTSKTQLPSDDALLEMCRLWAEVLELDSVNPDDDFFAIGGHSLAALRLAARLGDDVDSARPIVRLLLEERTPAAVLEQMPSRGQDDAPASVSADPPSTLPATLPMPANQVPLWLESFARKEGTAAMNVAVTVEVSGEVDDSSLQEALRSVIQAHDTFGISYIMQANEPTIRLLPALTDDDLAGCIVRGTPDLTEHFDLSRPPAMRVYIEPDGGTRRLTFVFHHLVMDGQSLPLLLAELRSAYLRRIATTVASVSPPDPTAGSRDQLWRWFFEQAQDEKTPDSDAIQRWSDGLEELHNGGLASTQSPILSERGREDELGMAELASNHVDVDVLRRFQALASNASVTPFEAGLALTSSLCSAHLRQSALGIAIPVSRRTNTTTQSLIGYLADVVVARCLYDEDISLGNAARRIAAMNRDAIHGPPSLVAKAVQRLDADHPLRRSGPAILFQYSPLSNHLDSYWDPAIRVRVVPTVDPFSRYELSIRFTETHQGMTIDVAYDRGKYAPATAERFGRHLAQLVEVASLHTDTALGDLLATLQ